MYNVQVLKYPTGWQVRVYSAPVGFCDNDDKEVELMETLVWNEEIRDWEAERYNPEKKALEPFTWNLAERLPSPPDRERSVRNSMRRTVNRVYYLSRSNLWEWFFTLTFDPDKVDSFDYQACVDKLKNWLVYVRRLCPGVKYLMVPEKHKSGRFHFHGLFANCDGLDFTESGHFTKRGRIIYNVGRYNLGWSTATKVADNERATKYMCKYITKDLCMVAFGKKRFWASRNLLEAPKDLFICENWRSVLPLLESKCKSRKVCGSEDGLLVHYYEFGKDVEVDVSQCALGSYEPESRSLFPCVGSASPASGD